MSASITCPACNTEFKNRRKGECPKCQAKLLIAGDFLTLDDSKDYVLHDGRWYPKIEFLKIARFQIKPQRSARL